jgi:hypothetical protein
MRVSRTLQNRARAPAPYAMYATCTLSVRRGCMMRVTKSSNCSCAYTNKHSALVRLRFICIVIMSLRPVLIFTIIMDLAYFILWIRKKTCMCRKTVLCWFRAHIYFLPLQNYLCGHYLKSGKDVHDATRLLAKLMVLI